MKQSDQAKKLGIGRSYLNGILNGRRRPSKKLALKISKLTKRSFFDLRPDLLKLFKENL